VAIVEKDLHNCRLGSDGKMEIICGNSYFQVMSFPQCRKIAIKGADGGNGLGSPLGVGYMLFPDISKKT
jgi:hypothetical protein